MAKKKKIYQYAVAELPDWGDADGDILVDVWCESLSEAITRAKKEIKGDSDRHPTAVLKVVGVVRQDVELPPPTYEEVGE